MRVCVAGRRASILHRGGARTRIHNQPGREAVRVSAVTLPGPGCQSQRPRIPAFVDYGVQLIVTESKHAALFSPVPPVWPSSQMVMEVPVAVIVPLNGTHVLLVVVWAGLKLAAVDQSVDADGLHLTVQVALAEFVRIQPAIVYDAPTVQPVAF